jgi:F-type H+-transporting ATPase subunit a
MEEQILGITRIVNHLLGPLALALLHVLRVTPAEPELPIPQHVVMAMLVVIIGSVLALLLRIRLSVERPSAAQQIAEMLLTNRFNAGIVDVLKDNAGHDWRRYIPVIGSVSIFILLSNLLGLVPWFTAPTSEKTVPLGCAIVAFVYFNWQGLRHHGPAKYLKHFAGPVGWLSWLFFPVEILSTAARLLSLTVRLWANIFASDMIYGIFLSLLLGPVVSLWGKHPIWAVVLGIFPALIPILLIGLHIFVAIVQSYVFTILPAVYIGLATADEH